jgi:hypothetical protein
VARFLVDKGYAEHYDYALQALRDIPYNKWRQYDHEDAVRFYALRPSPSQRRNIRVLRSRGAAARPPASANSLDDLVGGGDKVHAEHLTPSVALPASAQRQKPRQWVASCGSVWCKLALF